MWSSFFDLSIFWAIFCIYQKKVSLNFLLNKSSDWKADFIIISDSGGPKTAKNTEKPWKSQKLFFRQKKRKDCLAFLSILVKNFRCRFFFCALGVFEVAEFEYEVRFSIRAFSEPWEPFFNSPKKRFFSIFRLATHSIEQKTHLNVANLWNDVIFTKCDSIL